MKKKDEAIVGYCVRCKSKKQMQNIKIVKMKTGVNSARGTCITCGCKMCKILGKA